MRVISRDRLASETLEERESRLMLHAASVNANRQKLQQSCRVHVLARRGSTHQV